MWFTVVVYFLTKFSMCYCLFPCCSESTRLYPLVFLLVRCFLHLTIAWDKNRVLRKLTWTAFLLQVQLYYHTPYPLVFLDFFFPVHINETNIVYLYMWFILQKKRLCYLISGLDYWFFSLLCILFLKILNKKREEERPPSSISAQAATASVPGFCWQIFLASHS